MNHDNKFPFTVDGCLLRDPSSYTGQINWRESYTFDATMLLESSNDDTFFLRLPGVTSPEFDTLYPLHTGDLSKIWVLGDIPPSTKIAARWTFKKRNEYYYICLVE